VSLAGEPEGADVGKPRGRGAAAADVGTGATVESPNRPGREAALRGLGRGRTWVVEAAVLAGFIAAGVVLTWPRASYLTGELPARSDQAQYVWNMWWIAHQLVHPGNPWFTSYLAAPAGISLGFDTLTPLLGVVMAPVTLIFGPSASYNLLAMVMPGLASYAMYRLARLWLPGRAGPLAAGAFFGLSGMLTFQDWAHLHTAAGCVFLPLTAEAAVRLRRDATIRRGVILGVVAGASMLVDQQFAVLAVLLAALVLIPRLAGPEGGAQLRAVAAGAVTAVVIASPQLIAMVQQVGNGGTSPPSRDYVTYAAQLPSLFAPSPRLASYGMTGLASIYRAHAPGEGLATFGVVLTALAVLGLAVSWSRRSAKLLGALWLGSAVLALGPTLYLGGRQFVPLAIGWHGQSMSLLMPYTWLIQVPGMYLFREADRLALVGLIGAALLAGAGVDWLRRHARPVIVMVVVFGALEAGWPGQPGLPTMPTSLPAVDNPIAADHSGSIVVDVPFGIVGETSRYGAPSSPLALVLATADGHPRAYSYGPLAAPTTVAAIKHHSFYAGLVAAWAGKRITSGVIAAARKDLRTLHPGWVLVWLRRWEHLHRWKQLAQRPPARPYHPEIFRYLSETGFHFDLQADGVAVYRR
jgi:hypothetical protein